MKKVLFLMLFNLCAISIIAQGYSTIKGKSTSPYLKNEISLFKTVDGKPLEVAKTSLSKDGSFGFLYKTDEPGFYSLGKKDLFFTIYLRGDEEVNIDLLKNQAKLSGKNSKENQALYVWNDYAANVRFKSMFFNLSFSTYKDFFPDLEKMVQGIPEIKKKLKSGNKLFDQKLQQLVDYETDLFAETLLCTPRMQHPKQSDWPKFYYTIPSENKFTTDFVLEHPEGIRMLQRYPQFCIHAKGLKNLNADEYLNESLSHLKTPRLKGEYLYSKHFVYLKMYDQYLESLEKYKPYFVTASLKTRVEQIGSKLYTSRAGAKAADFTYPDANGKLVSLSDFKGKVVLVDVWATWCGPCKKEIPHLIKLEKEMRGTDLVVLGVSLDEAKNKQKWLDFIKEKGLGGIQLNASGWSKITKDYKIKGIPRFMVFDKKGNVVTIDAPRPSNPALKELLLKELKK